MTSTLPNASTSGGKSINTSSSHSPLQQQQQTQIISPGFDSSSRRSGSHSNVVFASNRNNQSHRKQHRNGRRPRLVDEDAMAESVSLDMDSPRGVG